MRTPSGPTGFDSTSRKALVCPTSPKRRLPVPTTIGNTISRYSSITSCSISVCTSCTLPLTRMSPPCCCLSLETSSATLSLITVELFHSRGSSSVEETTYLGMVLNLSANSPSLDGHAAAKPSYVTRPSRRASDERVSSSLNLSPSSPRLISNVQPACLKSSPPPGASMTPS